mgnify:CR=1 FL=1
MKSHFSHNPKILGGKPVLSGTRIPIARILHLLRDGFTLEAISNQYPHVDIKTLEGAIDELVRMLDKPSHGPQALQT